MNNHILKCALYSVVWGISIPSTFGQKTKPNVLFIAVDDLRPELGCYGEKQIKTPNIDRLAKQGTVFNRAYCQQAVCSPSRTSLLTGLYPDAVQVHDLVTHFRTTVPDVVTLPQYFKSQGYYTRSFGKIYHGLLDDPLSWSEKSSQLKSLKLDTAGLRSSEDLVARTIQAIATAEQNRNKQLVKRKMPAFECTDVPDNMQGDGKLAEEAIALLKEDKMKNKPFFLAVGFRKPHLPFVAPKKYWDMYDAEKIDMAKNPFYPENAPEIAFTDWGELRFYEDIPVVGALSDDQAKILKHGYYACVSYIDAQIGLLLDELDTQGLSNNTIVILWGDHGWKLGEHGMWCKHTNFEVDTRVPLICYSPGQEKKGAHSNALVEFLDIYPTLCELAGLPAPDHLQGKSFAPLLNTPDKKWKEAVFSQYPRPNGVMGYSMRTDRYRFTQWFDKNKQVMATELYDHFKDENENMNIAGDRKYESLISDYALLLRKEKLKL